MSIASALFEAVDRLLADGQAKLRDATKLVNEMRAELDADGETETVPISHHDAVLVRPTSMNRKLSPVVFDDVGMDRMRPRAIGPFVSSTFAPIAQTCPRSCAFRNAGCMAQSGYTGRPNRRLEEAARGMSALAIARREAVALDTTWPDGIPQDGGRDGTRGRDLRLHVSGDAIGHDCVHLLARASVRWKRRGGGSVWTFTHGWREVHRHDWGPVSALASIERAEDAELARARGFVPAIVVETMPRRAFSLPGSTTEWIPCPAETGTATCVQCRLCLDRTPWMHETNHGIAFAVHGPGAASAVRRLPVVR